MLLINVVATITIILNGVLGYTPTIISNNEDMSLLSTANDDNFPLQDVYEENDRSVYDPGVGK